MKNKTNVGFAGFVLIFLVLACVKGGDNSTQERQPEKPNPARVAKSTPSPTATPEPTQDPQIKIQTFEAFLRDQDPKREMILSVKEGLKSNYAVIAVSNAWHREPKQIRLQTAQLLWKAWAGIYSPAEPDNARIKIADMLGNEVGGSRIWGGSVIWVDD